jgi:hypothetical protein
MDDTTNNRAFCFIATKQLFLRMQQQYLQCMSMSTMIYSDQFFNDGEKIKQDKKLIPVFVFFFLQLKRSD